MLRLLQAFLDALYPPSLTCNLCGKDAFVGPQGLCEACAALLCPAPPLPLPSHLDGLRAGLLYDEHASALMHRFKYSGARYMAGTLAYFMQTEDAADAIVPVPLYPKRQKRRGYNQSLLLAQALSNRLGIPVHAEFLSRTRDTASQTTLRRAARADNVRGAFRASPGVAGLRLLLLDDVVTTGATLNECAAALKAQGALSVSALTVCAAKPPK
ncbi:MAG: ComF family protein [Christensenellaceae bacterium]|jgi:ComF family protein|nr:ComF family protein [Christensenellaceae bacterium]